MANSGTTKTLARLPICCVVLILAACGSHARFTDAEITKTFNHLKQSVEYLNQATRVTKKPGMSSEKFQKVEELWRRALAHARKINPAILNHKDPGFGDAVEKKLIRGLELCIDAKNNDELLTGQVLLQQFGKSLNRVLKRHRT